MRNTKTNNKNSSYWSEETINYFKLKCQNKSKEEVINEITLFVEDECLGNLKFENPIPFLLIVKEVKNLVMIV